MPKHLFAIAAVVVTYGAFSCNPCCAQDYSTTGSTSRVITESVSGGGSDSYGPINGGGQVTASALSSGYTVYSVTIKVEFTVTVTANVLPLTPLGYVHADDSATGESSATGPESASAYASSGYEYSPHVSLDYDVGDGNPYTELPSEGPYQDSSGSTTLKVIAKAYIYASPGYGGRASAQAESDASLEVAP
jgi:hypothetical protein